MEAIREFFDHMTRPKLLRKMAGYGTYWVPVVYIPERARKNDGIERPFKYQRYAQTKWLGRWVGIDVFLERIEKMECE